MKNKITQVGCTITSNFTELLSQYSNNTIKIPIEFTDNEFEGFLKFVSIQVKNFTTYNVIYPISEDNVISFPDVATYYEGTITISIFGTQGEDVKTSNSIALNIVGSNPTSKQVKPISSDWIKVMNDYADLLFKKGFEDIYPSINSDTKIWFIGNINTGVKAQGDVCTIDENTKHWLINGIDTGIIAEGHLEMTPATKHMLGAVIVGDNIDVDETGKIEPKTTIFTLDKLVIPTTATWIQLTSETATAEELENDPNLTYPWYTEVPFNCAVDDYVELQPNIPTSELGVASFNYSKANILRLYASDNLTGTELKFMVCRKTRKNEVV